METCIELCTIIDYSTSNVNWKSWDKLLFCAFFMRLFAHWLFLKDMLESVDAALSMIDYDNNQNDRDILYVALKIGIIDSD